MEVGTLKELNAMPGDVVECVEWSGNYFTKGVKYEVLHGRRIENNLADVYHISDLSELWRIISRASDDTPKLWRDMTDEEKGALLLAYHEGKKIEYSFLCEENWTYIPSPSFSPFHAYRVKPDTFRRTVTLMIDDGGMAGPKAIGTIQTVDGKPDCSTIEMEEL